AGAVPLEEKRGGGGRPRQFVREELLTPTRCVFPAPHPAPRRHQPGEPPYPPRRRQRRAGGGRRPPHSRQDEPTAPRHAPPPRAAFRSRPANCSRSAACATCRSSPLSTSSTAKAATPSTCSTKSSRAWRLTSPPRAGRSAWAAIFSAPTTYSTTRCCCSTAVP